MALDKTVLKNLIESKITAIFAGSGVPVDFTGNPDQGIEAFADAIITHLIDSGVSGSIAPELEYLNALGIYVGAPSGSTAPNYPSTIYVTNGDAITIAVGILDNALSVVSGSVSPQDLDSVCDRGSVTDQGITVDTITASSSGSQLKDTLVDGDFQVSGNIVGNITDSTFGDITVDTIIANNSGSILQNAAIVGLDSVDNKITNVADPINAQDAATKNYVDSVSGSIITDHGALNGLADDDHPQYLLADGTRICTGNFTVDGRVSGSYFEAANSGSQFKDTFVDGNLQVSGNIIGNITDSTFGDITVDTITANNSGSILQALQVNEDIQANGDILTGTLKSNGSIYINVDGPDGDSYLHFYDGSSPTGVHLKWSETNDRFEFSAGAYIGWALGIEENVILNVNNADRDAVVTFNKPTSGDETLRWDKTDTRFEFSDDLYIDGTIQNTTSGSSLKDTFIDGDFQVDGTIYTTNLNASLNITGDELSVVSANVGIDLGVGNILTADSAGITAQLTVGEDATVDGIITALSSGSSLKDTTIEGDLAVVGGIRGEDVELYSNTSHIKLWTPSNQGMYFDTGTYFYFRGTDTAGERMKLDANTGALSINGAPLASPVPCQITTHAPSGEGGLAVVADTDNYCGLLLTNADQGKHWLFSHRKSSDNHDFQIYFYDGDWHGPHLTIDVDGNTTIGGNITQPDTPVSSATTTITTITSIDRTYGNGTQIADVSVTLQPGTWLITFRVPIRIEDADAGNYDSFVWLEDGSQMIPYTQCCNAPYVQAGGSVVFELGCTVIYTCASAKTITMWGAKESGLDTCVAASGYSLARSQIYATKVSS